MELCTKQSGGQIFVFILSLTHPYSRQTYYDDAKFPRRNFKNFVLLSFLDDYYGSVEKGGGVYRFLVGKPEGRRPLWRPRRRWVENIRMDLLEVGCGYVDWIGLAQDRDRWRTLVSAVMNLRVP